jgi:hypothetical protein
MKVNATFEYPRFKYLSIELQGVEEDSLRALSGVFSTEPSASDSSRWDIGR